MQTAHVYSEGVLPVTDGFVSEEGKIPAGTAVSFCHAVLSAELTGNGNALFDGVENIPMLREDINAGNLHFFITAHGVADVQRLSGEGVFTEQMTAEGEVVIFSPIGNSADEVFLKIKTVSLH